MPNLKDAIIEVVSAEMPVDERLMIKKHRIIGTDKTIGKRICIVTGIHGDELEGQFVCYEVSRRIHENAGALKGIVDIYPAMNPIGIDSVTRGIPAFDLDMNRIFPGNSDGDMNEYVASEIIKDCRGADLCIDIHASNIFLTEVPQIRINELHKESLIPLAKQANMDFIWIHGNNTVLKSTFAYSLNSIQVPTLVVEMGVGMRITKEYGIQLADGIFSLMNYLEMWTDSNMNKKTPIISYDQDGTDVIYLNAPVSGVYVKERDHGSIVHRGDKIGNIIDPLGGKILFEVTAPDDGWLFTSREYPIVDAGSLVGRILKKEVYEK
ncbi:MAG: succinylglutamate desuccinylase/aspartoacylase family protein [Lachnospiraceae bacterium]|nr:succinylglutamate desuccinylase/aspartoacylase family protein [Lachnospiraceae bacterium]